MGTFANRALVCISVFLVLSACVTAPEKNNKELTGEVALPEDTKEGFVRTENEIKSFETFTEIYNIVGETDDRQSILPRIERLYRKIIREYPEVPIARESYWRLIAIYVNDYSPPDYKKAEALYDEFLEKHSDSYVKSFIEDELGRSYYRHAEWSRLLKFSSPAYKDQINKGIRARASLLYLYAEANYHLGNHEEAGKGYRIVADLYPEMMAGIKSKSMLKKIEETGD